MNDASQAKTYPDTKGGYIPLPPRLSSQVSMPQVVRIDELLARYVPTSKATLWRWIKAGTFPAPIALGPRVRAWDVEEVRKWIESKR
jgi:prophage regulatory protein